MNLIHKIRQMVRVFIDKDFRFQFFDDYGIYNRLDDETYLKRKYKAIMKKELNLDNPQTFNEKLQWLKLYDRRSTYTTLVDKYAVKEYVAQIIGNKYIIPTLGVWEKFDDINFDNLPNQFVLKCTHDSGGLVICKNKETFDINEAKKKINHSLKRDFFYVGREWPYKNVPKRIIAEKYMADNLNDYKFMCFNGKVVCAFVCSERYSKSGMKVTFFDNDWNVLPFERHYPKSEKKISKPVNLSKMIELSTILSKHIPFVRTDFYEIDGNVYFGELTFYPGGGFEEFTPEDADYEIGSWIILPTNRGEHI